MNTQITLVKRVEWIAECDRCNHLFQSISEPQSDWVECKCGVGTDTMVCRWRSQYWIGPFFDVHS